MKVDRFKDTYVRCHFVKLLISLFDGLHILMFVSLPHRSTEILNAMRTYF